MIKLAFFDLGETLIHDMTPFPGAIQALEAISQLETEAGERLILGLVSDFLTAGPPVNETTISAREEEYRGILAGTGLAGFFEPFSKRVTLSTRAGVNKPDRRIFELALERSGIAAHLSECAFVTETPDHLEKSRDFGMIAIRFGAGPGITPAFSDWVDAPALFGRLLRRDD
jgi:FMN phosphatase YigB (HAD superfamily)